MPDSGTVIPQCLRSVPKARGHIQGEKSFNPGFCNNPLKSLTTSLLCHIALEACLWLQYLTIFLSFWRTYLTVRIETFRHLYISKPRIANHYCFCCQARDARNIYNCDSWRQPPLPRKFAASHGSTRRRETRQRRPRALANAVCVTARASRLARIYCWSSSPQLSQWDEENPRLTALDTNRLFDVVILQNCQVL